MIGIFKAINRFWDHLFYIVFLFKHYYLQNKMVAKILNNGYVKYKENTFKFSVITFMFF